MTSCWSSRTARWASVLKALGGWWRFRNLPLQESIWRFQWLEVCSDIYSKFLLLHPLPQKGSTVCGSSPCFLDVTHSTLGILLQFRWQGRKVVNFGDLSLALRPIKSSRVYGVGVCVVGKDAVTLVDVDDKLWCSGAWPYHMLQRIPHLLKNRSWCVTGAPRNYASGAAPYGTPCQTNQVIKSERAHSSSLWDGNNTFGIEHKQEKRAQINNIHKQVTQTPCIHSGWSAPPAPCPQAHILGHVGVLYNQLKEEKSTQAWFTDVS